MADRTDELETALRDLRREVGELRAELQWLKERHNASGPVSSPALSGVAVPNPSSSITPLIPLAPPLAAGPPQHEPSRNAPPRERRKSGIFDRRSGQELEALVGRYGTVALAALLLVMATGVFLSWAISRIEFSPAVRVGLGALGALLLAAVGLVFRARGSRPFGSTLLGIALAVVHVDAWGAGPSLHVVSSTTALGAAAVASVALAALAWRAAEESLFVVGVGGALLAPFVATDNRGDVVPLLTYGWLVLSTAVVALRGEGRWRVASGLLGLGAAGYVAAAASLASADAARTVADAPSLFALACAASTLAVAGPWLRSTLARVYLVFAAVPLIVVGSHRATDVAALAAGGTILCYLALRVKDADQSRWLESAIWLPLVFLAVAVSGEAATLSVRSGTLAIAWAAAAALAAWGADEMRPAHMLVTSLASAFAIVALVLSTSMDVATQARVATVALAAHAAGFSLLLRRDAHRLLFVGPVVALVVASAWAYSLLSGRLAYQYVPFLTGPSVAALGAVAGWSLMARLAGRGGDVRADDRNAMMIGTLAASAGIAWGHEELSHAFSPDIATFLLILYFATVGVATIYVGRQFALPLARRAGLALAVFAALKAVYQASDLVSIALRLGSYVLVGCFLLGVAFWYRAQADHVEVTS